MAWNYLMSSSEMKAFEESCHIAFGDTFIVSCSKLHLNLPKAWAQQQSLSIYSFLILRKTEMTLEN